MGGEAIGVALPGQRQPWPRAVVLVLAGWALIAGARPDLIALSSPEFMHDHALLSIDIAISRAFCDAPSKISNTYRVPYEARDHAELRARPVRDLLVERSGSVSQYCLTVGSPIVNNENSLMWVESLLFRLVPSLSLDGLASWLHALRLAGLFAFGVLSLRLGAGLVVTAAMTVSALAVLARLDALAITVYPMDFVCLLLSATLAAAIAARPAPRRNRAAVVLAITLGVLAAFGGNLRTSHWPLYAGLPLLALLWSERAGGAPLLLRAARLAVLIGAFAAGHTAFQRLAIERHFVEGFGETAHHTTWHSTVIGLAIPPNALSEREHLEWSDESAWRLARSLDPSVRYISEDYERLLRSYYVGLWERDRDRMLAVYALKLRTAGSQMIVALRNTPGADARWFGWVLRPAQRLPNGVFVLLVYVAFAAVGAWVIRRDQPAGWLALMLSVTAIVVHLESVVITTLYVPQYHAFLAFAMLSASLAAPVLLASAVWRGRQLGAVGR